jgi:hypothetical protein
MDLKYLVTKRHHDEAAFQRNFLRNQMLFKRIIENRKCYCYVWIGVSDRMNISVYDEG